jgi:hypothetical protein
MSNVAYGIPLSIWYDWHDDGTYQTNKKDFFRLVHNECNSKNKQVYKPKEA